MATETNTLVLNGPDGCVVRVTRTATPKWPVMLQVDDIAVELDRTDADRLTYWLNHRDCDVPA